MQKKFLTEVRNGITPQTWWDREFAADNKIARYEIKEIFPENIFDTPKPAQLINRILQLSTEPNKNEIVLDFFSGSGTTAQAVMELNKEDGGNRKFILVQLPEKTSEESEAYKAGYKTIADICKERIRRVITRNLTPNPSPYKGEGLFTPNPSSSQGEGLFTSNSSTSKEAGVQMKSGRVRPDLFSNSDNAESSDIRITDQGFKVFKLAPSNFKMWRSDVIETEEDLNNMMGLFDTQVKPEMIKENILYELMLKSGFALTDTIENKDGYYSINNSQAVFVLDKVDSEVVERIVKLKPQNCVILDVLFAGNDQLKTNTALQMKDAGVEFVTI
jgi:adenine-specific DNA-methyltransferase